MMINKKLSFWYVYKWLPRGLAVIFTLFMYYILLSESIHTSDYSIIMGSLIPGTFVLIATLVAWKYPGTGAAFFVLYTLFYALMAIKNKVPYSSIIIMSGTPMLIAIMFLIQKLSSASSAD